MTPEQTALVAEIAAELGWAHDSSHRVNGPNGARLHVNFPQWPQAMRGRVQVSGYWPERADGRVVLPREVYVSGKALVAPSAITVAAHRGAAAIAAEIRRRYLPEYLRTYDAVAAEIGRRDTAEQTCEQQALALARAAGLAPDKREPKCVRWGVNVVSPNRVRFDALTVNLEQAAAILAILKPEDN